MARQLVLEGFMIRPLCHIVDVEADQPTIEPVSLGEQKVATADMGQFTDDQWPMMWASLSEQFKAEEAARAAAKDAAANDELTAARAARVAKRPARAKKATAKK